MAKDFLKEKMVFFPRNVIAGHDVLRNVKEVCVNIHSGTTGTIITGENTDKVAGRAARDHLQGYDIDTFITDKATEENIEEAKKRIQEYGSTFILAIGGGSKIDIAKVVANDLNIPFISIPTSAAHDGIASNRASIKSDKGSVSIEGASPMGVIADTEIIFKSPYRMLASGCADVLSNFSSLRDWKLAYELRDEHFSRSAYAFAYYAAESMMDAADYIRPNLEESVWLAIKPIIVSGISMSIARSSRPTSGSEHMISHTIDHLYPGRAMHGEQCGVASIVTTYLQRGDWEELKHALVKIGAPTKASELNLTSDEFIEAVINAHKIRKDRYTILGDNGITRETAEDICIRTGVI
ncbi:MAG: NAD(P)-dependent glycerol-1-phosphate dehydrogenase [Candidatus Methanomethylophilaceae archaeon]|jgi:glycerol-1-phosphate dehydrogenase [NAD(P)+]|nr:NAD(P)-dependent glycerol-1-phosphate dehydrogenase [Candidatus Methanomethylophilaceae archaeon]